MNENIWFYEKYEQILKEIEETSEDILFIKDSNGLSSSGSSTERAFATNGATIPALMRRLTTMETTSASEIWSFLLRGRMLLPAMPLIQYLHGRFNLNPDKIELYSTNIVKSDDSRKNNLNHSKMESNHDWILQDEHLVSNNFQSRSNTLYALFTFPC